MSPRRILWCILVAITFFFFYAFISVETFEKHDLLYSFFGGAVLFVTLFQALGDFGSLYELFEKVDPKDEVVPGRKLAPLAVFPAFVFVFVLIFHQGSRKEDELIRNGVLAKGTVVGGNSTKSTRRFQTTTSYSIKVTYYDSLKRPHTFDADINGSEYNNVYEGAEVDVIYSRKYPALAKVALDVNELSKFIKVPNEALTINHLTAILEGAVREDSVLSYLNSINYEWTIGKEGLYTNEKLDFALKVFPGNAELAFVEASNLYVAKEEKSFEGGFTAHGFKKKASIVNGKSEEMYYNDKYSITKEFKVSDNTSGENALSTKVYMIYHIYKNDYAD